MAQIAEAIDGWKRHGAGEKIVVLNCELVRSNRAGWLPKAFSPHSHNSEEFNLLWDKAPYGETI
jgi:hypothetical protein